METPLSSSRGDESSAIRFWAKVKCTVLQVLTPKPSPPSRWSVGCCQNPNMGVVASFERKRGRVRPQGLIRQESAAMTSTAKTNPLTSKDAVRFLVLLDPDLTNEQIQSRLDWLGLPSCTTFLISTIRASFREDVRLLEQAGLLRDRKPRIPSRIRLPSSRTGTNRGGVRAYKGAVAATRPHTRPLGPPWPGSFPASRARGCISGNGNLDMMLPQSYSVARRQLLRLD
jgi:hypothetical protein